MRFITATTTSSTRTKIVSFGSVALLAALPLSLPAGSASAATICRSGSVCTWSGNDFAGPKRTSRVHPGPGCYPWGGKTVSNQSGRTIRVYSGGMCSGKHVDIATGHWAQTKPSATIASIAVLG